MTRRRLGGRARALLAALLAAGGCAILEPADDDPLWIGTNAGIPPTAVYYAGYSAGYVAASPTFGATWPLGFVGDGSFPGYMAIPSIALGYALGYALAAPVAGVWYLLTFWM